jgi:hypothetical protein
MTKKITDLEDARAMKAMGLPLATEVQHREVPERCDKLIEEVLAAAVACRDAAYRYLKKQNASRYSALKRAHKKLGREI